MHILGHVEQEIHKKQMPDSVMFTYTHVPFDKM